MRFVLPILSVFALLAAACGQNADCTGQFLIREVNLPSTTHLSAEQQADVRLRLAGRCVDESALAETSERVRDAYQNFGYFTVKVEQPELRILGNLLHPTPVSLTFRIDEGPVYKLRSIEWNGVKMFRAEEIWKIQPMQPEDVFDTSQVRAMLDGVRRLYVSSGFPNVSVTPAIRIIPPRGIALTFRVDEGSNSKP